MFKSQSNNRQFIDINRTNWFGFTSLVITFVIAVLWFSNTPIHTDDFYYQYITPSNDNLSFWSAGGEQITSVSQIPEAIHNHWKYVNGRLANLLFIVFQPLPVGFVKIFCGLLIGLFASLFWVWYGNGCLKNKLLAIAIPILFWTGLQWNDQMQSSDYQFNYTIGSILMLGCAIVFFNENNRPKLWGWLMLALFSVWHEGFTIAFGALMGVQWLYRRRWVTFFALVILIVGLLCQLSPGTQARVIYNFEGTVFAFYPWSQLISKSWVSILALILWIIRRRKTDGKQRRELDRFGLGLVVAWFVSLLMIFTMMVPQRAHWPNDVLAICLIVLIIKTFRPFQVKTWLCVALLSVYALWGASLVYWQSKIKLFTDYCISEIREDKYVFPDKDNMLSWQIPFWLLDITRPQYYSFSEFEHRTLALGASNGSKKAFIVLPEDLIGKRFSEWPKVPGNNDLRFAGKNILVRKKDNRKLEGTIPAVSFGSTSLSTPPLDMFLGLLKGFSLEHASAAIPIYRQNPLIYMGDTLEIVHFNQLPRTLMGRAVTAVDIQ